jgi:hypothetical protein
MHDTPHVTAARRLEAAFGRGAIRTGCSSGLRLVSN